jgi:hypothetical protein
MYAICIAVYRYVTIWKYDEDNLITEKKLFSFRKGGDATT